MPAVVYPYAILAGRRSPLVPLGLGYQGKWQRVQAYVDSDAFYSVFKTDFALPLGLAWQQGERVYVQVGDVCFDDQQGMVRLEPYQDHEDPR